MTADRPFRLWVNMTTSAAWSRPAVGVVRVERALAQHLQAALGPDVCRPCVWRDGRFVEWYLPAGPATPELEAAAELILPRVASFDLARPYVVRALERFARKPVGATPADKVELTIPLASQGPMHAVRGDFIVSFGLDWEYEYSKRLHRLAREQGLRVISFCHDLIPVLFPQYSVGYVAKGFADYLIELSWGSVALLCNSEQTRRDYESVCSDFGVPACRTAVMPLGDNVPLQGGELSLQVEALTRRPFVLFVSTIERRKNHEVLYRAYSLLARRGLTAKLPALVFAGMPGWGVGDLLKDIELDPATHGMIVQLNHVSDGELNHLYRHAEFCLYPSLYEGWGLPVGEALAMGKAVLCSTEGPLPEVGGDLVRYARPWDVKAWADAMQEWIEDPAIVRAMEERVRQHYRPRQWSEAAEVVIETVRHLNRCPQDAIVIQPGYQMRTHVGVHVGAVLKAVGQAGTLAFGPYWAIGAGLHTVRVFGSVEGNAESVLFEIVSGAATRVHHRHRTVPARRNAADVSPLVAFDVMLLEDLHDVEVVCRVEVGSSLVLELIEIDRIGGAPWLPRGAIALSVEATLD